MNLQTLASLLIVLAIADVFLTLFLIWKARQVREPALEERATVSVILTMAAVLAGILAWAYLADFGLPDPLGTLLLFSGLILLSIPQFIWVIAYWRGMFK